MKNKEEILKTIKTIKNVKSSIKYKEYKILFFI